MRANDLTTLRVLGEHGQDTPITAATALRLPRVPAAALPTTVALLVRVGTDSMAPHLPPGALLAATAVAPGQPLLPGVYVWHTAADKAPDTAHVGRLSRPAREGSEALLLSLDNRRAGIICLLAWEQPGFGLYQVTHRVASRTNRKGGRRG